MKKKKYLKINKILDKYNFSNFLAVQNYGIFSGDQNLHKTITIVSLIEQIKNVEGDIIEFGVWNGNTSFLIKKIIDLKKINKKIYMVDHFKGLQNFSFKDKNAVKHKNKYAGNYHLIKEVINFFNFEKIKIFSNDILNFDLKI